MIFTEHINRFRMGDQHQVRQNTPEWKFSLQQIEKEEIQQKNKYSLFKTFAQKNQTPIHPLKNFKCSSIKCLDEAPKLTFKICINCLSSVNTTYKQEHQSKCQGFEKLKRMKQGQLLKLIDDKIADKLQALKRINSIPRFKLGTYEQKAITRQYEKKKKVMIDLMEAKTQFLKNSVI